MSRLIDLTGRRFGNLIAMFEVGRDSVGGVLWMCICDCGNSKIIPSSGLLANKRKSCGCLSRHGHTARGKMSTTYHAWKHMKERCLNPNVDCYKYHGARGIIVCTRWLNSFQNFLSDMGEKPEGLTLERINNNGNYDPDNCKWATPKEQARNTRRNKLIEYQGKTMCMAAWAEEFGINYKALWARLQNHSPEIAFNM